jgi:hypothetical protein
MCGGCGQPLQATGTLGAAGGGQTPDSDLPTLLDVRPPAAPAGQPLGAPARPAAQPANGAAPRRARVGAGGCLARGLLVLVITLGVLAGIAASVWGLAIRPSAHAMVDSAISRTLQQGVARVPPVPPQALRAGLTSFDATESEVDAELRQNLRSGRGLEGVNVSFQSGVVVFSYTLYGMTGAIRARPQVQGGALQVTQTQVDGPLSWVETGDELQATINQGLAPLRSKTPYGFKSVSVADGVILLTLNTSGG